MVFWSDHDLSAWEWVGMTAGMVLFWGLLIAGVVLLVRYLATSDQQSAVAQAERDPRRLLAERFARGEINKDEYLDRTGVLEGQVRS